MTVVRYQWEGGSSECVGSASVIVTVVIVLVGGWWMMQIQ